MKFGNYRQPKQKGGVSMRHPAADVKLASRRVSIGIDTTCRLTSSSALGESVCSPDIQSSVGCGYASTDVRAPNPPAPVEWPPTQGALLRSRGARWTRNLPASRFGLDTFFGLENTSGLRNCRQYLLASVDAMRIMRMISSLRRGYPTFQVILSHSAGAAAGALACGILPYEAEGVGNVFLEARRRLKTHWRIPRPQHRPSTTTGAVRIMNRSR
jgi:hypothetical protein